ncbi:YwqG family protein [Glycomyces salinus]|uniref:YwqG family protein n=1 Tax=Glycomyces salinus TaxID=980294 RepID=UPI0018EDAB9D|nr:YwqG family protein [Glycomyces salinus]
MTDSQELSELADRYLPPSIATPWKAMLKPAIQFGSAAGNDVVAAQLGGDPDLPVGEPWPVWEGRGPLSFIAAFDCAALRVAGFPLPEAGSLLFFYFDGQADDHDAVVGAFVPGTQDGARVVYVPAGAATERRSAPAPLKPYRRQLLRAEPVWTVPEPGSAAVAGAFGAEAAEKDDHPLNADAFVEAIYEEVSVSVCHQVGGYPMSVQHPVEYEVNQVAAELVGPAGSAEYREADRWHLLAQIDSDDASGMMWGDVGMLYWLIQESDLAAGRFDRAAFTWQCS